MQSTHDHVIGIHMYAYKKIMINDNMEIYSDLLN